MRNKLIINPSQIFPTKIASKSTHVIGTHFQKTEVKERKKNRSQKPEIKEKIKESTKKYSQKPETKEKKRKYYENNKEYFRQKDKQIKEKKKKDLVKGPLYKLHASINQGIRRGMNKLNKRKNQSSLEILGLESWDVFRKHIESLWTEGMSWDNYGNKR